MKILFLHKQLLFPRDTGGKIRALNLLKYLARWHDITYVCNIRRGEEQHMPAMRDLGLRVEAVPGEASKRGGVRFYAGVAANLFSTAPFSINRNYDPAIRDKVAELLAAEKYDLLICDCVQMAKHVERLRARANVLFQHNVEAQILGRHAEVGGRAKRWYMRQEHRKMTRFEAECGRRFDHVIAVSAVDRATFERAYGWRHVSHIDTAVDEDYFTPAYGGGHPGRVLFVGSMDWMPNQEGVRWFARTVWPMVRKQHPAAEFEIVGRNPPIDVRELAVVPGVSVSGGVPDVRPHLAAAEVFVVPLLVGGGTRLKIYEAMTSGKAVVSTTIGAEGLAVVPGEHYLAADDPAGFAAAVSGLLSDPARRTAIGSAADRFVRASYGLEPIARQFEAICERVLRQQTSG